MKLKGIFASLLAVLAFATACQKEADHYLDNIKVDQSYVGISPEGGSQTINLTATGSWTAASKVDYHHSRIRQRRCHYPHHHRRRGRGNP